MCNEIKRSNNKVEENIDLDRLYKATRTVVNNMSEVEIKAILEVVVGSICAEYMRTDNTTKVDNDSQMTPEFNAGTCIEYINNIYVKCKRTNTELYDITTCVGVDNTTRYTLNEILRMCKTTINASGIIYANVRDAVKYTPDRTEIVSRLSALINNYYIGDYAIEYVDSHETMIEKLRVISNHHRTKPVRKQAYDYIIKHGSLKGFGKCKMEDAWSLDEHEDKFLDFCYALMFVKNINTDRILDQIMGKGNCPDGLKSTLKYINDKNTAINKIKDIIEYRNIDCSKFSGNIRLFLNKAIKSIKSPNPTPIYMNNFYNYHNPPYSYNPYHTPYCYGYVQPVTLYNAQAQESKKEEE